VGALAQSHAFYAVSFPATRARTSREHRRVLHRPIDGDPWSLQSGRALDFRIISRPLSSVGVAPQSRMDAFALHVTPIRP